MKIYLTLQFVCLLLIGCIQAQSEDQEKTVPFIGFEQRIRSVEQLKLTLTIYNLPPKGLDAVANSELIGVVIASDDVGKIAWVRPQMSKLNIPDQTELISCIDQELSMDEILNKFNFLMLTEIQKIAVLKKWAIAVIVAERNIRIDLAENKLNEVNRSLKIMNLNLNNSTKQDDLMKTAKAIVRFSLFK